MKKRFFIPLLLSLTLQAALLRSRRDWPPHTHRRTEGRKNQHPLYFRQKLLRLAGIGKNPVILRAPGARNALFFVGFILVSFDGAKPSFMIEHHLRHGADVLAESLHLLFGVLVQRSK
jgi:hypothetical protein